MAARSPRDTRELVLDALRFLDNRGPGLVGKAIEDARCEQPLATGLGFLGRSELDQHYDLARVVHAAKDPVPLGCLPRAWSILVELWLPGVVVTDVDAGQDECHTVGLLQLRRLVQ